MGIYFAFFLDITMYECLVRSHDVTPIKKISFEDAIQAARQRQPHGKKRHLEEEEGTGKVSETELQESITTMLVSKTLTETRGHTSYLTFATFLPAIENNVQPDADDDLMETVIVEKEEKASNDNNN